jgi:predicted nucleic acid-binding protein
VSGPSAVIGTNVVVAARNPRESGFDACRDLLERIDEGALRAIVSTLTIAELRAGFTDAVVPVAWRPMLTHLLTSPNYRVEPVDVDIADDAGRIRSASRLTLPDAILVATGRARGASFLVTQDRRLLRARVGLEMRTPTTALSR